MSFGSWNMAEAALEATFSLLLCAAIIQGFQNNVETARYETTEAAVGQNVTLLCAIENQGSNMAVFSVEWLLKKHKTEEKVALLNVKYGVQLFWLNVSIAFNGDRSNQFMVSSLHLPEVTKSNGGTYICDFATFPSGSIRTETVLRVKDVEITCDADSMVDVHYAGEVIIRCQATSPDAEYRWTKNTTLVSVSKSLEISRVTDTEAGVYRLSVNAGSENVHKDFTIRLQTTSTRADTTTVSSQSSTTTSTSRLDHTEGGLSTSHTQTSAFLDSTVTVATMITTSVTDGSGVTTTAGEPTTDFTSSTHIGVTSSFTPHTDSEPPFTSAASTPGEATESSSTQEMKGEEFRNKTEPNTQDPGDRSSVTTKENSTSVMTTATSPLYIGNDQGDEGTSQRHLLVLILIPLAMLILTAGFLYRRHKIKQRMDLPPPFKPPPPPVKYVAVRQHETSAQNFPVSRCDSVADPQFVNSF
ncbi:uncharacterized protein si:ch1073-15f19.2 [Cynoglossus semilaevis]|uniref:uncharacterized protein si:ch1073-15f19.2 n=1 Tax=Cynoglossus semilaevis TaxID=244447 RepID=UPI000494F31E|nr:uncharacterized protein LOC103395390 [Cynoglossus semilaevis]